MKLMSRMRTYALASHAREKDRVERLRKKGLLD